MNGKTHLSVGVVTGVVIAATAMTSGSDPLVGIGSFVGCVAGSLLPDIDNRRSKAGNQMKVTSLIVNKMFGHRGLIHSPIFLLGLSLILFTAVKATGQDNFLPAVYGFIAGYLTHLMLDTLTKGGIPWLYPISKKRFSMCKMKSGSILEKVVALIFLIIFNVAYVVIWTARL